MKKGIFKWKGKGKSKLETDTVYVGGLYTSQVSGKVMVQVYPYNTETKKKGNFYEPYPYEDFKRDFEAYKKRASMEKLSAQATLKMLLEGLLRGIERAKTDPFVQEKYPRGIGFLEGMVKKLYAKAKRDPNYSLSEAQVNKLNQFLGGSSGVLSPILRRYIVQHCKGDQCTMVGQNDFRFTYVAPTYRITGKLLESGEDGDEVTRIDQTVERLSELLRELKGAFRVRRGANYEFSFDKASGTVKLNQWMRPNPLDFMDVFRSNTELTLQINGKKMPERLGLQTIEYFKG